MAMEQGPYRKADVDVTHAVRSIRMAAALNERYGAVVRVRSYQNQNELSNVLGEANQIYPEIWSLLDTARRHIAERGFDVTRYDAVRASPAAQAPAVLDVTNSILASFGATVMAGGRSATLNAAGHRAAAEACSLLRASLPQVDWDALDRAEASALTDINLGPPLWKKVVFYTFAGLLAAVAVAGYLYYRLGSPDGT